MKQGIANQFLVLAVNPEKGGFMISGLQMQYGLIGALLLQMSLDERIELKDNILKLKSSGAKKDPVLEDIESHIKKSSRPRKIKHWITRLGQRSRKYKWMLIGELQRSKALRVEKKKALGIFPYKKVYLVNHRERKELIRDLGETMNDKSNRDQEMMILLSMIHAAKLHRIFTSDRAELKKIRARLKEVVAENPVASNVDKTIREVQAAVIATTIAISAASSASTN
jgi:hypothetical protein